MDLRRYSISDSGGSILPNRPQPIRSIYICRLGELMELLQQGNVFTPVCDSVHSRACVVMGGGCVAMGACMVKGGMCGKEGGGCMAKGDMHRRRDGHCSGRYASYWNTFLFLNVFIEFSEYREK